MCMIMIFQLTKLNMFFTEGSQSDDRVIMASSDLHGFHSIVSYYWEYNSAKVKPLHSFVLEKNVEFSPKTMKLK